MVPNGAFGWRFGVTALAVLVPVSTLPLQATAGELPLTLLAKRKKKKKQKKDTYSPEQAATRRAQAQVEGRALVDAGDPAGAGVSYDRAASEKGDPVLFLDAGDAYLKAADEDRDTALAQTAIERAGISMDILYYHLDSQADPDFRLVEASEVPDLISRAQTLISDAEALIEAIEAEAAEPVATAAPEKKKRPKGDGKILKITGLGLASVGGALVVMGFAGLIIGAVNQGRAEDPSVYGEAYDDVESKGQRGNVLAGVGFAVGGAAAIAGVTMYLIGRNRAKKKKPANDDKMVRVAPTAGGLVLTGRF